MSALNKLPDYLESRREEQLSQLKEFLRIPSISTLSEHKKDILRAAQWLREHFESMGLDKAQVLETSGHPVVYAQWLKAALAPTVLIYGHYDVQPPDPLDQWQQENPFEPVIKNKAIHARGATDNKGQLWVWVKAVEALLKTRAELPVNIKFLIEGEEEIGSASAAEFVKKHQELLGADLAVLSDGPMHQKGLPTLHTGMRGLLYLELRVKTAKHDLHSGLFGGLVDNAANVLVDILAQLKNNNGQIRIPGFYDDVAPIDEQLRQEYQALPFDEKLLANQSGVKKLKAETGFTPLESGTLRPTLDINGILSGFTGEGSKTIIPNQAMAKVSMRLVPHQDPEKIAQQFEEFIQSLAPETAQIEVIKHAGAKPYVVGDTKIAQRGLQAGKLALKKAFDQEPVEKRVGGVIGIVSHFKEILGIDTIMLDIGSPDDNLHAPNEKFDLANFYGGIRMAAEFLQVLATPYSEKVTP